MFAWGSSLAGYEVYRDLPKSVIIILRVKRRFQNALYAIYPKALAWYW